MSANELCPHCVYVPLIARTNYVGGVYLECLDCGYYDSVKQRPSPFPDGPKKLRSNRLRGSRRPAAAIEAEILIARRKAS